MPTGRHASGAVHIPQLGDLVLGGQGKSWLHLRAAELLQTTEVDGRQVHVWKTINSMLKKRWFPSAVYFEERVFVVSKVEDSIEMLSITDGQPGQWTFLSECYNPSSRPFSMCVFGGRILLAGEFEPVVVLQSVTEMRPQPPLFLICFSSNFYRTLLFCYRRQSRF